MKYSIEGAPLPVVICELEPGEKMITESGAMSWMTENMKMETKGGGMKKMFGRALSGESLFLNEYTAEKGPGEIAFASSFPGDILAINVSQKNIVAQKSAFLCAEEGVEISTFFQKKFASGLFGGEGFIMQKFSGRGMVFVEIDGYVKKYTLAPGETLVVDTGYLAMMSDTCTIDVQSVRGMKNVLFGGEGLFNTLVTGPGDVWLQSMPASNMAANLARFITVAHE